MVIKNTITHRFSFLIVVSIQIVLPSVHCNQPIICSNFVELKILFPKIQNYYPVFENRHHRISLVGLAETCKQSMENFLKQNPYNK